MNKYRCKNELEKKLKQLSPWNFLIETEPGVFTIPREHWKGLWHNIVIQDYITRKLFPFIDILNNAARSDTTIIDIGCNEGWLSLLFHRIGYKKIVGIDSNQENIKKALFLKEYFNMDNVEFHCADINSYKTKEHFDFAIMLGVINHTHNPVEILQNIYSFTNKHVILDFDSLCDESEGDYSQLKYENGLSLVFGDMRCHFERAHQVTSTQDNNLVFQYSKKAMVMMINYAGFYNVLQLLPSISSPYQGKNDKRIFLVASKHKNKRHYESQLMLDKKYAESHNIFDKFLPELREEGYKGFNIVLFGGTYYGIPQEISSFDVIKVINSEKCVFGVSIDEIKELIDKLVSKGKMSGTKDVNSDFARDKLKYAIGCEFILQSRLEDAKGLFEGLKKKHYGATTDFAANILFQLGRISRRMGDIPGAKKYLNDCISIDSKFIKAELMLKEFDYPGSSVCCHRVFE